MKLDGTRGFAFLLIVIGALILFSKIGFGVGHLMSWIIPIGMAGLGYIGIRNGSKFFGWLFLALGVIILLGKMSGLIALVVAVAMILYGCTLFKRKKIS